MARRHIGAALLILLMALRVVYAQHVLDLTTVPKPPVELGTTFSTGFISISSEGQAWIPVQVTLVDVNTVDNQPYYVGGPIVFTVAIKSLADVPLAIPWTRWRSDHAALERAATPDQPLYWSDISLDTRDGDGALRTLGSVRLEGTRAVPTSIQILAPGETATIRVPGVIFLEQTERERILGGRSSGTVTVRAGFGLEAQPNYGNSVQSNNAVEILLHASKP